MSDTNIPPPAYEAKPPYPTNTYDQVAPNPSADLPVAGFSNPVNQQPLPGTAVVRTQYPNSSNANYGKYPIQVQCLFCNTVATTNVEDKNGAMAWMACCCLCILGFWCCAPIPLCMDSCHEHEHSCGNCGRKLGTGQA